ncbi:hypothetical protein OIU76_002194 [Salix suchowensis]|uniref:Dof zinc finger protein n=1 Tax=Salix suchowensis TaxID=1278906 RepID=A0ABQ9CHS0_9ROSI|nr:dof zinc finger protein [Salix suchowensis]KAJ6353137.1 hypothetical protein OIU76_002194 [Salix suchowensis]KAJ6398519.1 hypothetical protein OIU77_019332 [Salix suchowensis]
MPTELSSCETTRRPPLSAAPILTKPEGAPPQEQEHLPCPRCDSTNTKFCYYNNYNFSQPRHFCKSCRRYWTHGGTLRDIPIGGGTRRNAKRSRTSATTVASFVGPDNNIDDLPLHSTPVLVPLTASQGFPVHFGGGGDGKGSGGCGSGALGGSFTSLLSAPGPAGILTLGRFGHGLGHGLEDMECGLGRGLWSFPGIGDGGAGVGGHVGVSVTAGLDSTWQFESGPENCFAGGDCFSWPELAISTPANGFK